MSYTSRYHHPIKPVDPSVRGEVTLVFTEKEDGNWYSELRPKFVPTDIRDMYKLGLICASVQDHLQKNMAFMDTMIKTKAAVREIHNELVAEKEAKEKAIADTVKYQTKLPFKPKSDGNSLEDNGYDKYDGVNHDE
jgi:hypothetical protein